MAKEKRSSKMIRGNSKLRFAAICRVSTEKQEEQGESLRTQKKQITEAVKSLGGRIVEWYGGQEHATPGFEKTEIDRLLRDAQRKRFDAVIFTNCDRWSRDNEYSHKGLNIFKTHGIRFFIGTWEHDLHNPEALLFVGMNTVFGQFRALSQKQRSLLSRIERAKQGLPACGKKPFGRTFDEKTGKWGIDKKKKTVIEDIAKRYLAGERLSYLAEEYGMNHANLHKILTKRSGDEWIQTFNSDDLNIHKTIKTKIPRLLSEETIKAIKQKTQANKTYTHGEIKNYYLLSRMVFCEHCGYTMFGQTNRNSHRYYRHPHTYRVKKCNQSKSWIKADELEDVVICYLVNCFGNPAALQEAIEKATPNLEKVKEYEERSKHVETELKKVKQGRDKILNLIGKGTITESQAEKELQSLKQRESKLQLEKDRLQDNLVNQPNQRKTKSLAKQVARWVAANQPFDKMTQKEKRALTEMVFSGKRNDNGKRLGVYIQWNEKGWKFSIHGHLINEQRLIPLSKDMRKDWKEGLSAYGHRQAKLLTKSALY